MMMIDPDPRSVLPAGKLLAGFLIACDGALSFSTASAGRFLLFLPEGRVAALLEASLAINELWLAAVCTAHLALCALHRSCKEMLGLRRAVKKLDACTNFVW